METLEASMMRTLSVAILRPRFEGGNAYIAVHLEGGGVTGGFILPLGLMDGSGRKTAPDEVWWVMKAVEFGMKYGGGNHC